VEPSAEDAVVVPVAGGVEVLYDDVSYSYGETPALHGVSFRAGAGTVTALVGPTGGGKTTLVSLLPRLIDPDSGAITLNGIDHRDVTLGHLRNLISVVRQDPYLFPVTVADNLAYGRPHASRDEIVEAARAANAHDFIEALPAGYDTVLGDGGVGLSGGQRQRLAIARALLRDTPVLVLDEPTSALDAETEAQVMDAIERLTAGRTVLVIAHRLSTIRNADTIVVLDHGRVREQGTHDELLSAQGLYHTLHTTQFRTPNPQVSSSERDTAGHSADTSVVAT
jgi:ABC-type multidrug transport system fused ATPase/permease subunit